ncbi:SDR family oxidoreductase [Microbacterium sp. NPDC087665]|uniref:SDR family oxidoreductase n=1 Tax=Microbacterium sp. NPDC087665 TaxID=3364194 RepID=UPI00381D3358
MTRGTSPTRPPRGAIHAVTRAMAVDLGPRGVRVNTIAPGWIASDLSEGNLDSLGDPDRVAARLTTLHPVGRVGTPQDIGDVAVFLASDRAGFLSGETTVVDGACTVKLSNPAD